MSSGAVMRALEDWGARFLELCSFFIINVTSTLWSRVAAQASTSLPVFQRVGSGKEKLRSTLLSQKHTPWVQ